MHISRNAKTGGVFPLTLWAKGICTLLFPPGPSQQFQHLSVRLIRRETERKLVQDQKFKPDSESSISSFPFLMQRWDKAGSKALLILPALCLCLLWCQSTQQCSQKPSAEPPTMESQLERGLVPAELLAEPPWSGWSSSTSDPWSVPSTAL